MSICSTVPVVSTRLGDNTGTCTWYGTEYQYQTRKSIVLFKICYTGPAYNGTKLIYLLAV